MYQRIRTALEAADEGAWYSRPALEAAAGFLEAMDELEHSAPMTADEVRAVQGGILSLAGAQPWPESEDRCTDAREGGVDA